MAEDSDKTAFINGAYLITEDHGRLAKAALASGYRNVNRKRFCNVFGTSSRNNNRARRVFVADIILHDNTRASLFNFRRNGRIEAYLDYVTTHDAAGGHYACSASTDSNSLWIRSPRPA